MKYRFENVIFTDESNIWLNCYNTVCFSKTGQFFKVHVRAGISMCGATDIFIFTGIMDSSFYVENILKEQLLPFLEQLNPIENMWQELKYFLRKSVKPRNKQQLVDGIKEFWRSAVTIKSFTRYINHMHKVIPKVIKVEGHASGF